MLSDEWLPRYRLLENFTIKWNGNGNGNAHGNGNGNAYDRGNYNSSFALRAVELKSKCFTSSTESELQNVHNLFFNRKVLISASLYFQFMCN